MSYDCVKMSSLSGPSACSKGEVPVGVVVWHSSGQLDDLHAVFFIFRALQGTRLHYDHSKSLDGLLISVRPVPTSTVTCATRSVQKFKIDTSRLEVLASVVYFVFVQIWEGN